MTIILTLAILLTVFIIISGILAIFLVRNRRGQKLSTSISCSSGTSMLDAGIFTFDYGNNIHGRAFTKGSNNVYMVSMMIPDSAHPGVYNECNNATLNVGADCKFTLTISDPAYQITGVWISVTVPDGGFDLISSTDRTAFSWYPAGHQLACENEGMCPSFQGKCWNGQCAI